MPDNKTMNQPTAVSRTHCEVEETLRGGYCYALWEVDLGGVLLCGRHARCLEAQDRVDLLNGVVSSLQLSLRSMPLYRDTELALLLQTERAEAAQKLNLAHEALRRVEENYP